MAAGATSVAEPADKFYSDRLARFNDYCSNLHSISTHVEDLTPDELMRRLAAEDEE